MFDFTVLVFHFAKGEPGRAGWGRRRDLRKPARTLSRAAEALPALRSAYVHWWIWGKVPLFFGARWGGRGGGGVAFFFAGGQGGREVWWYLRGRYEVSVVLLPPSRWPSEGPFRRKAKDSCSPILVDPRQLV